MFLNKSEPGSNTKIYKVLNDDEAVSSTKQALQRTKDQTKNENKKAEEKAKRAVLDTRPDNSVVANEINSDATYKAAILEFEPQYRALASDRTTAGIKKKRDICMVS